MRDREGAAPSRSRVVLSLALGLLLAVACTVGASRVERLPLPVIVIVVLVGLAATSDGVSHLYIFRRASATSRDTVVGVYNLAAVLAMLGYVLLYELVGRPGGLNLWSGFAAGCLVLAFCVRDLVRPPRGLKTSEPLESS